MKVGLLNKKVRNNFYFAFSIIAAAISFLFLFWDLCPQIKNIIGNVALIVLFFIYLGIWLYYNNLRKITINIDNSEVIVKEGDLFKEEGLKVIAFNEYFDTIVDDIIISKASLNGIFINKFIGDQIKDLDEHINKYLNDNDILETGVSRKNGGKNTKYKLGKIVLWEDEYILTSFSKFDKDDRARLTMPEYIKFLIEFWDRINCIYAQRNVSVPIFGSGITRIKEHIHIRDEELLKIMLWTFKLSEYRFKYPAKLSIIIHKSNFSDINLLSIADFQ